MSMLSGTYFAIANPFSVFDRWLNPYQSCDQITLRGRTLDIQCTARARKALTLLEQPLIIEMQLYFTCVVQKRVNFSKHSTLDLQVAQPNLRIGFETVQSDQCSPETFAAQHPVKRTLNSKASQKMRPK